MVSSSYVVGIPRLLSCFLFVFFSVFTTVITLLLLVVRMDMLIFGMALTKKDYVSFIDTVHLLPLSVLVKMVSDSDFTSCFLTHAILLTVYVIRFKVPFSLLPVPICTNFQRPPILFQKTVFIFDLLRIKRQNRNKNIL